MHAIRASATTRRIRHASRAAQEVRAPGRSSAVQRYRLLSRPNRQGYRGQVRLLARSHDWRGGTMKHEPMHESELEPMQMAPHSQEIEEAVLGSILINPDAYLD